MNKFTLLLIVVLLAINLNAQNNINLNFFVNPDFAYNSIADDSLCKNLDSLVTKTLKDTLDSANYNFVLGKFFRSIPDSLNRDSVFVNKVNNLDFIDYITPTDFHYTSRFASGKLFASNLMDTTKTNYPKQIVTIEADSFRVDVISLYSPDFTITANLDSTIAFAYSQKIILKKLFSNISKDSDMIIVLTSYPKFICKRIFPKDRRIRYIINFDSKKYRDFKFRKRVLFKSVRFRKSIGQIHLSYKNKRLYSDWHLIKKEKGL